MLNRVERNIEIIEKVAPWGLMKGSGLSHTDLMVAELNLEEIERWASHRDSLSYSDLVKFRSLIMTQLC